MKSLLPSEVAAQTQVILLIGRHASGPCDVVLDVDGEPLTRLLVAHGGVAYVDENDFECCRLGRLILRSPPVAPGVCGVCSETDCRSRDCYEARRSS